MKMEQCTLYILTNYLNDSFYWKMGCIELALCRQNQWSYDPACNLQKEGVVHSHPIVCLYQIWS